jgi:hypothetical protein
MTDTQIRAMGLLRERAVALSVAATPALLARLDSPGMRAHLRACCRLSGLAKWPAERLLSALREHMRTAELCHNFDGSFETDVTLEIMLNATAYLPSAWPLRYLGYYGPMTAAMGHPRSPEPSAEEGVFLLPHFSGPYDLPASWAEASSRLQYIAHNALRVDAGNLGFGRLVAVYSPSLWADAVAAAPFDTGLYTMRCNASYYNLPNATRGHFPLPFACDGADPSPGVAGAMDHAFLNNDRLWSPLMTNSTSPAAGQLGRLFSRWYGDSPRWTDLELTDLGTYLEADVLAHAHYSKRAIKLLVGSFASLFGAPRGELLRRVAAARGVALAWSLGPAQDDVWDARSGFDRRLLDASSDNLKLVNATLRADASKVYDAAWSRAAAARAALPASAGGTLPRLTVLNLWDATATALEAGAALSVPAPGECADWERCLGRSGASSCVCYV